MTTTVTASRKRDGWVLVKVREALNGKTVSECGFLLCPDDAREFYGALTRVLTSPQEASEELSLSPSSAATPKVGR